ncbi:metal ABC transporter solute-binding protein, Zn/Mn family [Anaerococcus urinomassiliensis]|uniref:metal ABC transporter solute-binding protein, Zn/Mn family n=1 Tax=Anaerococcus urinomassiliensis TaxID=1745712 RepID=UPI00093DD2C0|nr:zinc ABC transporter substrate-binding protein [Anaerococcus urinomassiliensis]
MKYKNLALVLALGLTLGACGQKEDDKAKAPSNEPKTEESIDEPAKKENKDDSASTDNKAEETVVYTSFYPIYNLTKQIAGDKMEVKSFTNLKAESHGWEPSAKDIKELSSSKLMFINGAGMEEWESSLEDSTDIELVDTSEGLDLIKANHEDHDHDHEEADEDHEHEEAHDHEEADEDHEHEEAHDHEEADENHEHEEAHDHEEADEDHEHEDHDHEHNHGEFDPHTWLSPKNGLAQAKVIAEKLGQVDPANKDYYMDNYKKIEDELNAMIDEYSKKFEETSNKNFLVNHKAFSYIARDFNLNQIALTSLTSTDDTDAKTLKEAAEEAKELNINTIFYEMGGSDKNAKTLADEIGAEIKPLNTLELATDEDLDNNKTYQELIRYNLEEIYKSLEK